MSYKWVGVLQNKEQWHVHLCGIYTVYVCVCVLCNRFTDLTTHLKAKTTRARCCTLSKSLGGLSAGCLMQAKSVISPHTLIWGE